MSSFSLNRSSHFWKENSVKLQGGQMVPFYRKSQHEMFWHLIKRLPLLVIRSKLERLQDGVIFPITTFSAVTKSISYKLWSFFLREILTSFVTGWFFSLSMMLVPHMRWPAQIHYNDNWQYYTFKFSAYNYHYFHQKQIGHQICILRHG